MMFNTYRQAAADLDYLLSFPGADSYSPRPKEAYVVLYEKLRLLRPYKSWDEEQYYDLACDMIRDKEHPAWRFFNK